MRDNNGDVELAHSFVLGVCDDPECTALHFQLERVDGKPFAVMTVNIAHVPLLIEKMKNAAYKIAATKGDV
jgi:hypothetical protein